jgi:hypothetical protein
MGSEVTIRGANFDPLKTNDTVFFGGVKAYIISATANSLVVTVPAGAVYGPVSVTTSKGLTAFPRPFIPVFSSGGNVDSTAFEQVVSDTIGAYPYTLTAADLDGDGRTDLAAVVVNTNEVAVLRNAGQPGSIKFASPVNFGTGAAPFYLTTADLDGDGKLDLAVTNRNANTVSVLRNTSVPGTISFTSKIDFSTGSLPLNIATADLDSDGKVDMVTVDGNADMVSVFRNTTPGPGDTISFAVRVDIGAGAGPTGIALGDLDGDGKPDMVVCDPSANQFLVFRNTSTPGAISFAAAVTYPAGTYPQSAAIADLDGDGKPELIIGNSSGNNLFIYRNLSSPGAISLATPVTVAAGSGPSCISISDVNGDGKPDITLADASAGAASVLQNNSTAGNIVMGPVVLFRAGNGPEGIVSGDFDGDGKPDMALANYGGSQSTGLSVLRNLLGTLRYPAIDSFAPASARQGDTVRIYGTYFTGATAVSFGNTAAASYTVVTDSMIAAVVGNGATGLVAVMTSHGTVNRGGFHYIAPAQDSTVTTPQDSTVTPPPDSSVVTPPPPPQVRPGFQLVSFTGAPLDEKVVLQWQTVDDSSETYYVVQYSPDSVSFDGIGSVKAKGVDSGAYAFTDPVHAAGVSYYRLKMEDTAGNVMLSPIVTVGAAGIPEMLTVFPNPASDVFTVEVPPVSGNSVLELVDMAGHVAVNVPVKAGVTQVTIYVRTLNRGVYKLIWSDGVNKAFRSVLIIRR